MTRYKLLVQTNSLRQSLQLTEGSWCRSADDLLLEVEMYLHINHHLADLKDIRSHEEVVDWNRVHPVSHYFRSSLSRGSCIPCCSTCKLAAMA